MKVIDRETVKFYLGIKDSSLDAEIDEQLPIIDVKVKQISKHNFNTQIMLSVVSGSLYAQLLDDSVDWLDTEFMTGTLLEGEGIAAGSFIDETYPCGYNNSNVGVPYIKLSAAATQTLSVTYIYAGINKAYQSNIAKGVYWLILQTGKEIDDSTWISKSGAGLSVSRSAGNEKLDNLSGMPAWFVKGLPRYGR